MTVRDTNSSTTATTTITTPPSPATTSPDTTSRHATAPPWSLFALRSHDVRNALPLSLSSLRQQHPADANTDVDSLPPPPPLWSSSFLPLRRIIAGPLPCSPLPPIEFTMSLRRKAANTAAAVDTPSVVVENPDDVDEYAAPRTRSSARHRNTPQASQASQATQDSSSSDGDSTPGKRKSRTRSRSPIDANQLSRMTPRIAEPTTTSPPNGKATTAASPPLQQQKVVNGNFLAPPQPAGGWSWRDFSRSPSPLGLIPIHRHFKTFVHKHEVPRKALHVSIGFFVCWLYTTGTQTSSVPPYLMAALVPIAATDLVRHRFASVNRLYVRVLGALMRESEYAGYNGVIWYLLGAWSVLYFLPKDVGVMSVLLLSWCDTAASTFGRLWGRYTIRLRRGKSLAGSLAAFAVGIATSYFWYAWLVPKVGPMPGDEGFMFKHVLALPAALVGEENREAWSITGSLALGVMSVVSGFVASASEVVDIFGWDDNLTIPVLSGLGIWGFLKVFG